MFKTFKRTKYSAIFLALTLIFILFTVLQLLYFPSSVNAEIYDERKLDEIKKEKEDTHKKIEEAQKEQEKYSAQVEEVEKKLLDAFNQLIELNSSLAEAKSEHDRVTILLVSNKQEIEQIENELQEKTDKLNIRIAEIYKTNNRNFLDVLLKSEGFIEFISRLKLMNLLLRQDLEIIKEIKDRKNRLLAINKNMLDLQEKQSSEKQRIEKLIALSEQNKREIEAIYNEKLDLFSQAKANKDALIAMENQLTAKETEITNILKSYNYGTAPAGKLLWPTIGKISSGFGPRTSKNTGRTRMHNGIDIYAPLGTPVVAADSGQVLRAEYYGGYGLVVLVYHGGGVATYYAHLSGYTVSVGQFVQRGQVIGYVGNTGYTTGYHLHFEVRIDGVPKNPRNYL
ncbi:MAG: hypothetical protein FJW61_03205 [Actinobacteria bacterium]|nr:hypothetical protein [Actinomycetota bacterium]